MGRRDHPLWIQLLHGLEGAWLLTDIMAKASLTVVPFIASFYYSHATTFRPNGRPTVAPPRSQYQPGCPVMRSIRTDIVHCSHMDLEIRTKARQRIGSDM